MSEQKFSPKAYPIEAFEQSIEGDPSHRGETLQFADLSVADLRRIKGQRLSPRAAQTSTTILTMENGRRICVGGGVITALPKLNTETGCFTGDVGMGFEPDMGNEPIWAMRVEEMVPDGLPDVVIGEAWPTMHSYGTVQSAMIQQDAIITPHDVINAAHQVDMPHSHLWSAHRLNEYARTNLVPRKNDGMPVDPAVY